MTETYQNFRAWLSIEQNKQFMLNELKEQTFSDKAVDFVQKWFPGMDRYTWGIIAVHVINNIKIPSVVPPNDELTRFIAYIVNAKPPFVGQTYEENLEETNA